MAKNLPAMHEIPEMQVRSPVQEDPLEEGHRLQYYCLENSMDIGAWWTIAMGLQRIRHDQACTCTDVINKLKSPGILQNCWLLKNNSDLISIIYISSVRCLRKNQLIKWIDF